MHNTSRIHFQRHGWLAACARCALRVYPARAQFCYIMSLEFISSDAAAILNLAQIVIVAALAISPLARWLGAEQET